MPQVVQGSPVNLPKHGPLDIASLPNISIQGAYYELNIATQNAISADQAVMLPVLIRDQLEAQGAHVVYVAVGTNDVTIQFRGSPFYWASIFGSLDMIFVALGLVLIMVLLYLLITSVPGWVWGVVVVGSIGLIFLPSLLKSLTAGGKAVQRTAVRIVPERFRLPPPPK